MPFQSAKRASGHRATLELYLITQLAQHSIKLVELTQANSLKAKPKCLAMSKGGPKAVSFQPPVFSSQSKKMYFQSVGDKMHSNRSRRENDNKKTSL